MKKICLWIICLIILLAPWLSVEAKPMKSIYDKTNQHLPPGAFWVENHWKNTNGFIEVEPVQWRASDTLGLSGSAIPTLGNMIWLKKKYGGKHSVYILDLRQETHLYIDGLPISLFYKRDEINWGKTPEEISKEEDYLINYFLKTGFIHINKLGKPQSGFKVPMNPHTVTIKDIYSEQVAAQKAGLGYFRIEVPDYHPPAPDQVDQFLAIIKQLPQNAWLHIHCAAGKGRTTTFMIMRDIVTNAKDVSLEDILAGQEKLGGINLFGVSPSHSSQPWKKEYHQARRHYIKLFYTYVHSGAYPHETFSAWIKKQPENPYKLILKTDAYIQ